MQFYFHFARCDVTNVCDEKKSCLFEESVLNAHLLNIKVNISSRGNSQIKECTVKLRKFRNDTFLFLTLRAGTLRVEKEGR